MDSEPSRVSRVPDIPAAKPPNQYGDQYLADLADLVGSFLGPNADTVVEYGTGASTWVLAEALAKRQGDGSPAILLSIDHNDDWQRNVASSLPHWPFLHLRTYDLFGACESAADVGFNYATAPYLLRRGVDLAYVDGRTRAQCVLAVAAILKDGGWVILDDAERERYQFLDCYFNDVKTCGRFKVYAKPKAASRLPASSIGRNRLGILRVIHGRQAEAEAAATRFSVERYAHAIGAELVDRFVSAADTPAEALKLMLRADLEQFDRTIFIDCDLVIRAGTPSLFDLVPDTHLGIVREDRYLDRSDWLDRMAALYDVPREHGGLPAPYFNGGVIVLSRCHYSLFILPEAGTLYAYPLFEQTYLNARVRTLGIPLYELSKEFNFIPDYDRQPAMDWRYGWLIHLAGYWEGERRTHAYWHETARLGGFSIRNRQPIVARDTRVPRLRALARAIDCGERVIALCPPHFAVEDERRVVYDPEHSCLVIDLHETASGAIVWGPYITLDAGSWAVAIQLRGAAAPQASLLIDCAAQYGTRSICPRTLMTADDDGVIRFRIDLDQRTEKVEFRFWQGCQLPVFFEALELRPTNDCTRPRDASLTEGAASMPAGTNQSAPASPAATDG